MIIILSFLLLIIILILLIINYVKKWNNKLYYKPVDFNNYNLYDCFMISSGEEDLLLLRLKLLYPYVTKFIIIDSDKSHRGHNKDLVNMNNIPNYIKNKIIYENCIYPDYLNIDIIEKTAIDKFWKREYYQRNRIMYYLSKISNDNDICFIGDADEIPYYDKLLKKINNNSINFLELPTFVYNINWFQHKYHPAAAICSRFKYLKNIDISKERFKTKKIKKQIVNYKDNVIIHLNRFGNPYVLLLKETHMVESNNKEKNLNVSKIRDYFNRVCNGIWEDNEIIQNNNIKFPQLVYDILHPIHTMNITELKNLFIKVSKLSDNELVKFTKIFFNYR